MRVNEACWGKEEVSRKGDNGHVSEAEDEADAVKQGRDLEASGTRRVIFTAWVRTGCEEDECSE